MAKSSSSLSGLADLMIANTSMMNEIKSRTKNVTSPLIGPSKAEFTYSELIGLTDSQLYHHLYQFWEITNSSIDVWGVLEEGNGTLPYVLVQVHLVANNKVIEYPYDAQFPLNRGVYVSKEIGDKFFIKNEKTYLQGTLVLSPKREREHHKNPFELNLSPKGVVQLQEIPIDDLNEYEPFIKEIDTNIVLGDGTQRFINKAIFQQQLAELEGELNKVQEQHQLELKGLLARIESETETLGNIEKTVQSKQSQNTQLKTENNELKQSIAENKIRTADLNRQYKKIEESMARKIEKLTSFIEEKAVFLKTFEFIDEEDFESFVHKVDKSRNTSKLLSFNEALKGDYKLAVSYIQAYMKEQDILYPRHIIENYLTLLRTNDLIILAGDSGSGKTNLVNSFAESVGGVSKIIPVKPNWTSSEDLLGYYNPLEKKYLATPFLEALIEAQQNPEVPYFICLDEMNLARVEYYFADFLSKLEERNNQPIIELYSDDEASHVLSELKGVNAVITAAKEKFNQGSITDFVGLMTDENINAEIKRAFGFSEKESLIKYHGEIRRMLAGIINTPSSITIPENVRIIGAVNIDETTHYLSPKILDRAHIMKFKSPLLSDWDSILKEVDAYGFTDVSKPVLFAIDELGVRAPYPKYDGNNEFCALFKAYNSDYFHPLGVEFGMRTIRQGLNYLALFKDVNDDRKQAINNFIIHKVLPKFTFDGDKKSGDMNKLQRVAQVFYPELEKLLDGIDGEFSAHLALSEIIDNAESNDSIVNYWA
ncbi:McrB family protein [Shewanella gaetbuli]